MFDSLQDIGGQLTRVFNPIPDYAGLLLKDGEDLKEHLRAQLSALDIRPQLGQAIVEITGDGPRVITARGEALQARGLILATGVEPRRLGVPGEVEFLGRGTGGSPRRDRDHHAGLPVAIVGGGDAALENALLLAEVCSRVVLIHRRSTFRARAAWLERVRAEPRIEVLTDTRVKAMLGTDRVQGVKLETPYGERTLDVSAVFVRIGVGPVSQLVQRLVRCDPDGYVQVDADQRTSTAGIYAIGDVCNPIYSSLATAAGQGMVAAKAIARGIAAGNL